jgi:hypothetical protein
MALFPYSNAALTATTVLLVPNTSAGAPIRLAHWNVGNPNTVLAFIQFFDAAATSAVTLGTTAPTFTLAVPAFAGAIDTSPVIDYTFKNGIVVAATTTQTGNTALSSTCQIQIFTK